MASASKILDGTKVVNCAQWESREAFQATLRNPGVAAYFRELVQIRTTAPC